VTVIRILQPDRDERGDEIVVEGTARATDALRRSGRRTIRRLTMVLS